MTSLVDTLTVRPSSDKSSARTYSVCTGLIQGLRPNSLPLYSVSQAYTASNPALEGKLDPTLFRGMYGSLGTWERPLGSPAERSTLVPITIPVGLPPTLPMTPVAVYSART